MYRWEVSNPGKKSDFVRELMSKHVSLKRTHVHHFPSAATAPSFNEILRKTFSPEPAAKIEKTTGWRIKDYLKHPVYVSGNRSRRSLQETVVNADRKHGLPGRENLKSSLHSHSQRVEVESSCPVNGNDLSLSRLRKAKNLVPLHTRNEIYEIIDRAARKYNVPVNIIRGIIEAESGFNEKAVSKAGAMGLMQLMPGTAKELGVSDPFDVAQNIDGGVKYFKKMLNLFKGNLVHALAAYNAGPGAVMKHSGVPPYKETQKYVRRVLRFSGIA